MATSPSLSSLVTQDPPDGRIPIPEEDLPYIFRPKGLRYRSPSSTRVSRFAETMLQKDDTSLISADRYFARGQSRVDLLPIFAQDAFSGTYGVVNWMSELGRGQFGNDAAMHWLTSDLYEELIEDLPINQQEHVMDANSEQDARLIRARLLHYDTLREVAREGLFGEKHGVPGLSALGTTAPYVIGALADPMMWRTGMWSARLASTISKSVKTSSKLVGGMVEAGIWAGTETLTSFAYMSLAQKGNPYISEEEIAHYVIGGAAFAGVIGGGVGAWRATKQLREIQKIQALKTAQSERIMANLGDQGVQLFRLLYEAPIDVAKKVEAAFHARRGNFTRVFAALDGLVPEIDALPPKLLAELLDDVRYRLELDELERLSADALNQYHANGVLGVSADEIRHLKLDDVIDGDVLELAQIHFLEEMGDLGKGALAKVIDGDLGFGFLSVEELKWLAKTYPEVFEGGGGFSWSRYLDIKSQVKAGIASYAQRNLEALQAERAMLQKPNFKVGQVVLTKDGQVLRIREIGKEGIKTETLHSVGLERRIKDLEKEVKALEKKLPKLKRKFAIKRAEGKLLSKRQTLARAQEELTNLRATIDDVIQEADAFLAPAAIRAQFDLASAMQPGKLSIMEGVKGRYKKGWNKMVKGMQGRLYGLGVEVTLKSIPRGKDIKWQQWSLKIKDSDGGVKTYHLVTQEMYDDLLKSGTIKKDVPNDYRIIKVYDKSGKNNVRTVTDSLVRARKVANLEKELVAEYTRKHLLLSSPADPPNLLQEMADGKIPDIIKRFLGEDFETDSLIRWAKRQLERSPEERAKLNRGDTEGIPPIDKGTGLDIPESGIYSEAKMEPLLALLSGKIGFNTYGLTHESGAVNWVFAKVFGSHPVLKDLEGLPVVAGGAAEGVLGSGMIPWRRMEVASRMAPLNEVWTKVIPLLRKAEIYKWHPWKLEDQLHKWVKLFVETDKLDDVPLAAREHVQEIGEVYRKSIKDILVWAQKNGLKEMEGISPNKYYFPRFRNHTKMQYILAQFPKQVDGANALIELIARGILKAEGNPIKDPKIAETIATHLKDYYMSPSATKAIFDDITGIKAANATDFVDKLDDVLGSVELRLTHEQKAKLIEHMTETRKVSGRSQYKINLKMDESVTFTNKKGRSETVQLSELFETNIAASMQRYIIDMVSKVQEDELLRLINEHYYRGTAGQTSVAAHFEAVVRNTFEAGIPGNDQLKEALGMVLKFIQNTPKFERKGRLATALQVMRQTATMVKLGGFTPAQLPEAYMALFSTGFFNKLVRKMPVLNHILEDAKRGAVSWQQAKQYVTFDLGMGKMEHELSQMYALHEMIEEGAPAITGKGAKFFGMQARVIPRIAKYSGFKLINTLSDIIAHKNFIESLIEISRTGENKVYNAQRLASLGLTPDDFDSIIKELAREGVVTTERVRGVPFYTLHTDLLDPNVAARYRVASAQNIRQVVQRSNVFDMPIGIIESQLGELLSQFRAFSWSAMGNHLARNAQAKDRLAYSNISTMLFGSMMTHIGMTCLNYSDDPQRRREMLSPLNIARGTLMRSAFLGIWGDLVDLLAKLTTGETMISPSNKAVLVHVPVIDQLIDFFQSGMTGAKFLRGGDLGKDEAQRAFGKINPINNFLYVKMLLAAFSWED